MKTETRGHRTLDKIIVIPIVVVVVPVKIKLTLKARSKSVADNILKKILLFFRENFSTFCVNRLLDRRFI